MKLTRRCNRAIQYKGHNSIFIYGAKGTGKSTYALLLARSILNDWESVLKVTCFTRKEILDVLAQCYDFKTDKVIKVLPVLIWDDATFENLRSKRYDDFVFNFTKFYTVIRSVVANFIWTAPNFRLLPSTMRSMDWQLVRILRPEREVAHAHFYRFNQMPVGKEILRAERNSLEVKIFEPFWFKWIPQDIRDRYENKRDSYSIVGYKDLKDAYELELKKKEFYSDKYE